MKPKTKTPPKDTPEKSGETFVVGPSGETFVVGPSVAPASTSRGDDKPDRIQLAFDLDSHGKPDYSSMREKTKEKLRTILSDPGLAGFLGVAAPAASVQIFPASMVAGMYDMLGKIEQSVFPMFFPKVKADIWERVFTYTDAEKEALVPPTMRVMNKYASEWMIKYQDELMLAGLLLTTTLAKIQMAITLTKFADGSFGVPSPNGPVPVPDKPDTPIQ